MQGWSCGGWSSWRAKWMWLDLSIHQPVLISYCRLMSKHFWYCPAHTEKISGFPGDVFCNKFLRSRYWREAFAWGARRGQWHSISKRPGACIHGLRVGGYSPRWLSNGMASLIKTDGTTKVLLSMMVKRKDSHRCSSASIRKLRADIRQVSGVLAQYDDGKKEWL